MASDMTDEEREKLALQKLMSAMGRGKNGGGGEPKLKSLVRKSMLQKQFDPENFGKDNGGGSIKGGLMKNGMPAPDDPDLVPPSVVLDLWFAVADGIEDESGE